MDSFPDIPVINYHKISAQADVGITSRNPDDFYEDIFRLNALGYQTITFEDLLHKPFLPPKPIILTFDDGYRSVLEKAYPILQSFGFTGVVYMPTAYIGKQNDWDVQFGGKRFWHLSQDDLRVLHKAGFEIGSHGCTHRALTALPRAKAQKELSDSKKLLEDLLGAPVYSVSYPFGRINRVLLEFAKTCGYTFGVVSIFFRKSAGQNGLERLALRRLNIYRMDSPRTFENKVTKGFRSPFVYRDWIIQRGSMATILWQAWIKRGSKF